MGDVAVADHLPRCERRDDGGDLVSQLRHVSARGTDPARFQAPEFAQHVELDDSADLDRARSVGDLDTVERILRPVGVW